MPFLQPAGDENAFSYDAAACREAPFSACVKGRHHLFGEPVPYWLPICKIVPISITELFSLFRKATRCSANPPSAGKRMTQARGGFKAFVAEQAEGT